MSATQIDLDGIGAEGAELARYRISAGERVLMGWGRGSGLEVTDRPAEGRARGYVVDRGVRCVGQLRGFLGDYLDQASRLDACPMSSEAIGEILARTEDEALLPLLGKEA